jgi:hypothetical protein
VSFAKAGGLDQPLKARLGNDQLGEVTSVGLIRQLDQPFDQAV